jgi:hypothetical protein
VLDWAEIAAFVVWCVVSALGSVVSDWVSVSGVSWSKPALDESMGDASQCVTGDPDCGAAKRIFIIAQGVEYSI